MKKTLKVTNAQGTSAVSEIELIYRSKTKASDRPKVNCSKDAYRVFISTWEMDKMELQEHFRVLFLDRNNACMGVSTLAAGGITQCITDLRLVFAAAIKIRAVGVVLAHNHPSGNTKPSRSDKDLTNKFAMAGQVLDVPVLDSLVITKESYTSFADEGLLPHSP